MGSHPSKHLTGELRAKKKPQTFDDLVPHFFHAAKTKMPPNGSKLK
jgi:hypothetical protein